MGGKERAKGWRQGAAPRARAGGGAGCAGRKRAEGRLAGREGASSGRFGCCTHIACSPRNHIPHPPIPPSKR